MTFRPLVLVALAALVPVFCMDMRQQRCELRDQLRGPMLLRGLWEHKVARVICEVEKFAKSMMGPTMSPATSAPSNSSMPALNSSSSPFTPSSPSSPSAPRPESSSEEDSSEERREHEGVGKYLRQCIAMTNSTEVKVDAACLRKSKVFMKVYLNAGEECKKIDAKVFFKGCSNPSSKDSEKKSNSKERPNSKQFESKPKFGKNNHH